MGANVKEAKRLEEMRLVAERCERLARAEGLEFARASFTEYREYLDFMDSLMKYPKRDLSAVRNSGVRIVAADRFQVEAGAIFVDCRKPIEEIVAFLTY